MSRGRLNGRLLEAALHASLMHRLRQLRPPEEDVVEPRPVRRHAVLLLVAEPHLHLRGGLADLAVERVARGRRDQRLMMEDVVPHEREDGAADVLRIRLLSDLQNGVHRTSPSYASFWPRPAIIRFFARAA